MKREAKTFMGLNFGSFIPYILKNHLRYQLLVLNLVVCWDKLLGKDSKMGNFEIIKNVMGAI